MFKIAFCVVGGGYAILAVADEVFSRKLKWTDEGEIVAHLPVFQMVPGIIAGSTAIYVGRKIAGWCGVVAALLGVFLPSVIVFSIVSAGYSLIPFGSSVLDAAFLGLRAALTGIIAAMTIKAWRKSVINVRSFAAMLLALFAIGCMGWNPALVVIVAAAVGVTGVFAADAFASKKRMLSSFWLFPLVFLKYGVIAFGGGYVLVPVYMDDFVGSGAPYLALAAEEFADVMALTQMTPGPIAVNCATFFGYRLGMAEFGSLLGAVGSAFVATLALLFPGAILLYFALGSLEKFKTSRIVQGIMAGVKPVTISMMLNALWAFAAISVWNGGGDECEINLVGFSIALFAGAMTYFGKLGIVKVIFVSAALSIGSVLLG
ncbi:MAG: chromate transporter [Kiritimatiellae bacterium]|nr:chromate transporter [Kiritimatiellia bacterium]